MQILIVEDDPTQQVLLERMLERLGHHSVVAATGVEAWAAMQTVHFDVVMTDYQMPELDGMALTRLIRARRQDRYTYLIMVTAHSARESYLDAIVAGVDDFLPKPLDSGLVAARLHVAERIIGLQAHVRKLESIMSVCSYCKKVRDGSTWVDMEGYVGSHYGAWPSHGICAECLETRVKPELAALGIPWDEPPPS